MKRRFFLILITGLLIFALAACTGTNKPSATVEVQNTPVPAEEEANSDQEDDADTSEDADADTDEVEEEEAAVIDAAAIYSQRCASCHGANREGGGGPALLPERLTKDPSAYKTTIIDGSGPMPAWGSRLSAEEIDALVEFILSDPQ